MEETGRKVVFITGASRGIGRAVAVQLAADGYDIAFCFKNNQEAAGETVQEIKKHGARVFSASCDVSQYDAVKALIDEIEEKFGDINVLINNAGIARDNPLVLMEPAAWTEVIQNNLDSIFNVCRCAIFSFMKRKEGCIINISSASGVYGNPTQTNYSAAKAGIIGFSKALAKEVGSYGIRVNVVAPGFIKTDFTSNLTGKHYDKMIEKITLKRPGEAVDVAHLVSFLVSEKARYITGQTIQVDGGIII